MDFDFLEQLLVTATNPKDTEESRARAPVVCVRAVCRFSESDLRGRGNEVGQETLPTHKEPCCSAGGIRSC